MEIINGKIVYTDKEIAYFNKVNPTIFDIAVMANQQLGEIFYTRNCKEVLKPGMTLVTAQRVDVVKVGRCAMNVLMGHYKNTNLCGRVTCTIGQDMPSCFEYTWKEVTGQMSRIERWGMSFEERKRLLIRQKSIKAV